MRKEVNGTYSRIATNVLADGIKLKAVISCNVKR